MDGNSTYFTFTNPEILGNEGYQWGSMESECFPVKSWSTISGASLSRAYIGSVTGHIHTWLRYVSVWYNFVPQRKNTEANAIPFCENQWNCLGYTYKKCICQNLAVDAQYNSLEQFGYGQSHSHTHVTNISLAFFSLYKRDTNLFNCNEDLDNNEEDKNRKR